MMKTLVRLFHGFESALLYLLVMLLVGLSVYQIVLRNVFESGLYWADPLMRVIVLWLALVGAMMASREGGHIKIDVLSHYLSARVLLVMRSITAIFSAAICFIAAYYSVVFVLDEREYGVAAFADVPAWWCEAIIPVGLLVIGLRFVIEAFSPAREEVVSA
jgi:TRAP-type C4-dicarboxylate transport system permease small subunit